MVVRQRDLRTAKYAFVRGDGSFLTPFRFEWAEPFTEGLAAVRLGGRLGFINERGDVVIDAQFDPDPNNVCSHFFYEGLAAVRISGKCGYVDRSGHVKIEPRFDGARRFRSGLAMVWDARGWAYIDQSGQIVWSATQVRSVVSPADF